MSPLCELIWEGALDRQACVPSLPAASCPWSTLRQASPADRQWGCWLTHSLRGFSRVFPPSFLTPTLLSLSLKEHMWVPPELLALCASVHLAVGIAQGPQPTTPTAFAGPEPENLSPFPNAYRISLLGPTHRRV